jgi:hypothetical protein
MSELPDSNRGVKRSRKTNPDEIIRRLRVGDLNKLFALRYGGRVGACDWQFPKDDAGLEDLKILAHHYAGNALALPRIITLRAPWADVEAIQEEVFGDPKKWRAKTLGRWLNLDGAEWRASAANDCPGRYVGRRAGRLFPNALQRQATQKAKGAGHEIQSRISGSQLSISRQALGSRAS